MRGFEPPKPRRVAVLRTAAANRICLTCTSWRKVEGSNPDLVLGESPGFQDQLPATPAAPSKLVLKQLADSMRFELMAPFGHSALAVRCLKPLGQLSVSITLVPAGGIEPPRPRTLRFECSASSHSARPARLLVGARGVEPPSPKALDSKSSAASSFATLLCPSSLFGSYGRSCKLIRARLTVARMHGRVRFSVERC